MTWGSSNEGTVAKKPGLWHTQLRIAGCSAMMGTAIHSQGHSWLQMETIVLRKPLSPIVLLNCSLSLHSYCHILLILPQQNFRISILCLTALLPATGLFVQTLSFLIGIFVTAFYWPPSLLLLNSQPSLTGRQNSLIASFRASLSSSVMKNTLRLWLNLTVSRFISWFPSFTFPLQMSSWLKSFLRPDFTCRFQGQLDKQ